MWVSYESLNEIYPWTTLTFQRLLSKHLFCVRKTFLILFWLIQFFIGFIVEIYFKMHLLLIPVYVKYLLRKAAAIA
jgi:hypothetical protein